MSAVSASLAQAWVTKALGGGLSPRSVVKYHVVLHGIFGRAVRDRVIGFNPAADTDLPKVVNKRARIITPEQFERLLAAVPDRYRVLVLVAIETGMRWGELAALRPRHLDLEPTGSTSLSSVRTTCSSGPAFNGTNAAQTADVRTAQFTDPNGGNQFTIYLDASAPAACANQSNVPFNVSLELIP